MSISLRLAAPPGFDVMNAVRESDPGHGGIAVICRRGYRWVWMPFPTLKSFEGLRTRPSMNGVRSSSCRYTDWVPRDLPSSLTSWLASWKCWSCVSNRYHYAECRTVRRRCQLLERLYWRMGRHQSISMGCCWTTEACRFCRQEESLLDGSLSS